MKKSYLPFLIPLIIFLAGVGFLGYAYYKNVSNKPGALQVSAKYGEADVTFRGKSLGKTPIEVKDLKPGRGELVIKGAKFELKKDIYITEGALTVVTADTGVADKFNANMTIWYDKASGNEAKLFITSTPSKAIVKINDKDKGETPLTISQKDLADLGDGDEYAISLDKDGYEGQVINLKLEKGYTLNLSGNLFLNPIHKDAKKESTNSYNLYKFKSENIKENTNGTWASGISYFASTRGGIQIANETIDSFEYFVDTEGTLFNKEGGIITGNTENKETGTTKINIAYLGDKDDLSDKAMETLNKLFGQTTSSVSYIVTETGLGYLNIRKEPNVSGEVLGKINVGEKINVKELQGEWYKIDYNGKDAYAFAQYIKKVEPEAKATPTPSKEVTPSASKAPVASVKASPVASPKATPEE